MKFILSLIFLYSIHAFSQNAMNPTGSSFSRKANIDYTNYYDQIRKAEDLVAKQEFAKALPVYQSAFDPYGFLFLKDCKTATQVAIHAGELEPAFYFLKLGFRNGLELKSVQKEKWLASLQKHPSWKSTVEEYPELRAAYLSRINPEVRDTVRKMFRKDQRKAMGALFTFTSAAQDKYAEKKFAPHSEKQMAKLLGIIKAHGYPGEQLIGTEIWASVILSHHNSITEKYAQSDSLYPYIRPKLLDAVKKGQMNPNEFAFVDDWFVAVGSGRKDNAYGILQNDVTQAETIKINKSRKELGLRSLETQFKLSSIQQLTGIQFYIKRAR
ncbi:hypothetical protein [Dyadobacter sp. 32]|uniref:hypothetical protein n=1 Tax=Dyadobacter sp. 32 TaxID=538966 RepID=UPI0011EF5A1D